MGEPVLVGDVGGTNVRFALAKRADGKIEIEEFAKLAGDNFDLAFPFQFYDGDGQFSFTENFDDRVEITITPIVSAT
ncbi:glucokinase, partial [uncultured Hyphomonas sp.]|uniref:glucokinase n=1 Tax=uncultured Hyphomonas sp. TaxID=225298 RepID=UPI00262953BA